MTGFKNEAPYKPWKPHESEYDAENAHVRTAVKIKDKKPTLLDSTTLITPYLDKLKKCPVCGTILYTGDAD